MTAEPAGRVPAWRHGAFVVVAGVLLLWPAVWNGYPLVFGDTGTYLTDGVRLHVSWPRPFFYGLAMAALHWKVSAWPVVVAQGLGAAALLRLTMRLFVPGLFVSGLFVSGLGEAGQYGIAAVLAAGTSLPWFASQLMPDLFGALAVLALAAVVLRPERLRGWQQVLLVLVAAASIAFHQSYVPTLLVCVAAMLGLRWWRAGRVRAADLGRAFAAPVLAIVAVVAANAVFQGRVSFSPYGNIFVLARLVVEGPGERTLARECPRPGWTLCGFVGRFPDNVEQFQFGEDGIVSLAGGYRTVSAQAGAIVADTVRAEPEAVVGAAVRRALRQLVRFQSGDWLLRAHHDVDRDWASVFPPGEVARYLAARQQRGLELIPDWLQALHVALGALGMAGLAAGAWVRRGTALGGLLAVLVVAVVVNGLASGALSGVYDRYQSRFVWLGVFGTLLWLGAGRGYEDGREGSRVRQRS